MRANALEFWKLNLHNDVKLAILIKNFDAFFGKT